MPGKELKRSSTNERPNSIKMNSFSSYPELGLPYIKGLIMKGDLYV